MQFGGSKEFTELSGDYVLEYGDNRDLFESKPDEAMVANVTPMTGREADKLDQEMSSVRGGGHKINFAGRAQKLLHRVLSERVNSLSNVQVLLENGSVMQVSNGKDLVYAYQNTRDVSELAVVMNELYEVCRSISRLEEGRPEALRSQSADSSVSGKTSSNGAATAADAKTLPALHDMARISSSS